MSSEITRKGGKFEAIGFMLIICSIASFCAKSSLGTLLGFLLLLFGFIIFLIGRFL